MTDPPSGLPRYRLFTGPDDIAFCHRVSEALDLGYVLYGGPALTHDGEHVVAGQAVIWPPDPTS
jgi:hypothetical protein